MSEDITTPLSDSSIQGLKVLLDPRAPLEQFEALDHLLKDFAKLKQDTDQLRAVLSIAVEHIKNGTQPNPEEWRALDDAMAGVASSGTTPEDAGRQAQNAWTLANRWRELGNSVRSLGKDGNQ